MFCRKSLHPRPRRGLSSRNCGNIDLVLYGNYDQKIESSSGEQSTSGYEAILQSKSSKSVNISENTLKTKTPRANAINEEETTPLKGLKLE